MYLCVRAGFLRNPNATGPARNPQKELFNFARLRLLEPGATEHVRLSVPAQVLSLVDELGTERLVAGYVLALADTSNIILMRTVLGRRSC